MKVVVKALAALNISTAIPTAALAWFLGRNSVAEIVDIVSWAGLGMGALGALMFIGSTSRSSASTGIAASAADQPSRMMNALWKDRTAGVSTGALFVLSGLGWLGMAWLLASLFGGG